MGPGYYGIPDACWLGTSSSALLSSCQCMPPPYTTSTSSCQATPGMCQSGFTLAAWLAASLPTLAPNAGGTPTESATGSSLYVPRANATLGWRQLVQPDPLAAWDTAIAHLAVTSDLGGWGDVVNLQFAVWTVADPTQLNLYAMPLPLLLLDGGFRYTPPSLYFSPYESSDSWTVVPTTYPHVCSIEAIAVAQWQHPQTPTQLAANNNNNGSVNGFSFPTDVAAVVVDHTQDASLWIYFNTLAVNVFMHDAANWGSTPPPRTRLAAPLGAEVVALGHAYLQPGSASFTSTFYVAYNADSSSSGVLAVVRANPTAAIAIAFTALAVDAMAVMPSPDGMGVLLYVIFRSRGNSVQLVRWATTTTTTITTTTAADELFFPPELAGRTKRALSVLWPSTALAPLFFALVDPPPADANAARAILHPAARPQQLQLVVADTTQRTFSAVQDLPAPFAAGAFAATGVGANLALLLAVDGQSILFLPAANCAPLPPSAPARYWDGARCLSHACVRSRSCDLSATTGGQRWDALQMRCACIAGFYKAVAETPTTPLKCGRCMPGFYCPGSDANGTSPQLACPVATMVSPPGADNANDCACPPGSYYYATTQVCATCPAGSWCPNGWTKLACPSSSSSAIDLVHSAAVTQFPVGCACAAGFIGPACAPCPSGFYCPGGTSKYVINNALALSIATAGDASALLVCPALLGLLRPYFAAGARALWYLQNPTTLAARAFCQIVPVPAGRASLSMLAVLMVQTEVGDQLNSILLGLPAFFQLNSTAAALSGLVTITAVTPANQPTTGRVANNTALQCPTGMTPDTVALVTCVCAAGYASSTLTDQGCVPCPVNQYKAGVGPGNCLVCPIGTSTAPAVAAAACAVSGGDNSNSNSNNSNSNTNNNSKAGGGGLSVAVIAACVGGGVVLLVLLLYGISSATG